MLVGLDLLCDCILCYKDHGSLVMNCVCGIIPWTTYRLWKPGGSRYRRLYVGNIRHRPGKYYPLTTTLRGWSGRRHCPTNQQEIFWSQMPSSEKYFRQNLTGSPRKRDASSSHGALFLRLFWVAVPSCRIKRREKMTGTARLQNCNNRPNTSSRRAYNTHM